MIIYKYYKQNCQPCATLGKILDQLSYLNLEIIEKDISIEDNKKFLIEKGIDKVPVIMTEDGRISGLKSKQKLEDFLLNKKLEV